MSEYIIQGSTLTSIADAIRAKSGLSEAFTPAQMVSAIGSIPTGGSAVLESLTVSQNGTYTPSSGVDGFDSVVVNVGGTSDYIIPVQFITGSGSFSVVDLNMEVTSIRDYAFASCSNLTSVNFPACSYIGISAFRSCSNLTYISFPSCTTINLSAFDGCRNLTSIDFPACTYISSNAFYNCSSLSQVSFPACVTIAQGVFNNCTGLTSVYFPSCVNIGGQAFAKCSNLTQIDFPECTTIGYYAFDSCSALVSVSFPALKSIYSCAFSNCQNLPSVYFPACEYVSGNAFANCWNLSLVSLPACTRIMGSAFSRCYNLISLYLLASAVCSLSGSQVFYSSPIGGYSTSAGRFGSIFVPSSLYDAYISATNWSFFSERFVSYTEGA